MDSGALDPRDHPEVGVPMRLNMSSARILLVDDHPLVRDGLRSRLTSHPGWTVVAEAEDVPSALGACREHEPDVAVIDLSLKNANGLDLIKRLLAHRSNLRILVCSMHDENIYAERAIDAGAHGYVHKQEASKTIVQAMERVIEGRLYASDNVIQRLLTRNVTRRGSQNSGKTRVESLTDRELQVFEGLGRGYTVQELAVQMKLSRKTVETYRDRIKRKLELDSSHHLTHFAVKWLSEHAE
jgi:DNA-binding NarL/FixJ family response regulator